MKSVLVSWFSFVAMCVSNVSLEHLSERDVVGVAAGKKPEELIKKALLGVRSLIRTGDDTLALPIMDPYKIEGLFWHYEDEDSGTNVHLSGTGPVILKGLADFKVSEIKFDLKSLLLNVRIDFGPLNLEVPYKIEGVAGHLLPIYGEDLAKIRINKPYSVAKIDLSLEESRIVVDKVSAYSFAYNRNFDIDIPGFMDLLSEFSAHMLADFFMPYIRNKKLNEWTEKFVQDVMEKHFIGKTMDEATELLNYLSRKAD